jgi:hypothetical protein
MFLGMPIGVGVWTGLVALALSPLYNLLASAWGGVQFQAAIIEAPVGLPYGHHAGRSAKVRGIASGRRG